ncbi:MAG: twin-arginine translocase TatA/TatE family subunit [Chloroflexi bacterium]|nr:twin-arginine translocase TatA/TatE family subunit [Chloroflexota bacterium]
MPFGLGIPELLIILLILVILFGVGRLPQVGQDLGKSIRAFRSEITDEDGSRPHKEG